MFYTKYRPQKFTDIIKPNTLIDSLVNQVKTAKTAHAYLFVGSRGTGKTTTARILAKALNCEKLAITGDPCDECDNCLAIKRGNFLDLVEIDAASNRGIDDIRDLRDKVRLAPSQGHEKIYIIDEVHMLTNEAFNALLKTLEEPPKHVIFILCTTEFYKVPDTIKSRCQVFKFKRATVTQIVEKLERICHQEQATLSKEDLKKIAQLSYGGFRDAETLLQQIIEGNTSLSALSSLGSGFDYPDFVDFILEKDSGLAIKHINKVIDNGADIHSWVGELIKYLRDLLIILGGAQSDILDIASDHLETMQKQVQKLTPGELVSFLEEFMKAHIEIKNSFIPQLPIEMAIVKLCAVNFPVNNASQKTAPVSPVKPTGPDTTYNKKIVSSVTSLPETNVKSMAEQTSESTERTVTDVINLTIGLDIVVGKWTEVLKKVSNTNGSIQALLKSSKLTALEGNYLVLEVLYSFHKERLENPKNRKIVEDAFLEIFGEAILVRCKLSKEKPAKIGKREIGELTDYNVIVPVSNKAPIEIFDGGLPLG